MGVCWGFLEEVSVTSEPAEMAPSKGQLYLLGHTAHCNLASSCFRIQCECVKDHKMNKQWPLRVSPWASLRLLLLWFSWTLYIHSQASSKAFLPSPVKDSQALSPFFTFPPQDLLCFALVCTTSWVNRKPGCLWITLPGCSHLVLQLSYLLLSALFL